MKRFGLRLRRYHGGQLLLVALCVFGAGCDDDDNPSSPSSQPLVFSALLSPANEVPAIGNAEGSGSGAVQVTITPTRNASGAITAATADFHVQLYGFPAGTRVQGAHIHSGVAGVNGPIRIDTGLTAGTAETLSDGTLSADFTGRTADPAIVQAIVDNPAAWYFNVHSPVNPGGFARGQLMRVQ
jgi:hypothetical protein